MSLASRVSALASAVAGEFNAVRTEKADRPLVLAQDQTVDDVPPGTPDGTLIFREGASPYYVILTAEQDVSDLPPGTPNGTLVFRRGT